MSTDGISPDQARAIKQLREAEDSQRQLQKSQLDLMLGYMIAAKGWHLNLSSPPGVRVNLLCGTALPANQSFAEKRYRPIAR